MMVLIIVSTSLVKCTVELLGNISDHHIKTI